MIEAVQSRAGYISGSRDDLFEEQYEHVFDSAHLADAIEETHQQPHVKLPASAPFLSADAQLASVLARLTDHGWTEVLAVDLTPPGAPFAVARVLVPRATRADC